MSLLHCEEPMHGHAKLRASPELKTPKENMELSLSRFQSNAGVDKGAKTINIISGGLGGL